MILGEPHDEPPAEPPAVQLEQLTKHFGAVVACDRVDLELHRGRVHGVLGENGAGKSTLMKMMIGLVLPDHGSISIDGRRARITSPRDAASHGIAMVHQHLSLVDDLTVWENVALGDVRFNRARTRARISEIAEQYGLEIDPMARVRELPAGLRQRVELIKCLRREPSILIFDEPTSVLTPEESVQLFESLRRVVTDEHRAVALVSHKLDEILHATDDVTIMRQGAVVARMRTADADAATLARAMLGRPVSLRSERAALGVPADALVARWDLAAGVDSPLVTDRSRNGLHGTTVNMPTRGVTGHLWTGRATHFQAAAAEYDAIHFHDDDIDDVGWEPDVEWQVPVDLPSGVYALRLDAGDSARDYVPFFVVPQPGSANADVAFLAPTNSYYAYANERLEDSLGPEFEPAYTDDQDRYDYMAANRLLSMYDFHSDGSGVCYSSRLRPNLTMRPSHYMRLNGIPHLFSGDLHLVDWLEHEGYRHDVLTDEALHFDGSALLEGYRVVITGTHPEYWSEQMLDALDEYLAGGGRLMYLGGNGFYWVTAFDPERPHVIEIRRPPGTTRAWEASPGEYHLSSTGEPGGLWRHRGREPQKLLGVGFTAQGFDRNAPYYINPDLDSRAAFVFDGIDASDGKIGDHRSLVLRHGAAGFELDRADYVLGTPVGTLLLASTRNTDFSDSYQHVVEEIMMSNSRQGATVNELVRADMVIVPYPQGGTVFSVGSISWCGGLSVDDYGSDVSVITRNVLDAFLLQDWAPF